MLARRGFTFVELMITLAVVAVLLTLAAPSLYDFVLVQRLKSINAQLVTDLQFARSEAVSHFERRNENSDLNADVQVIFSPAGHGRSVSCYSIYIDTSANPLFKCDCTQPVGQRCPAESTREIRTVQIPSGEGVRQSLPDLQARGFSYLSTTGAIRIWPVAITAPSPDFSVETAVDSGRRLRTTIGPSGRPTVCSPDGGVRGYTPC